MKISRKLRLGKSQYELDFVDVDPNRDTPLFVDPYFLAQRYDSWSIRAARTIRNFFEYFITLLRSGKRELARELFNQLGEPNETCLGLSRGRPQGRGIGKVNADDIFKSLLKSKAVLTGVIEDIEDCRIFVEGIDKDKISDMATNVIRGHLIEYTQQQCRLWGIPLTQNVPSGFLWQPDTRQWESGYTEMLVIGERKSLLVPKAIVSYSDKYTPQRYHRHFVLNFLQHEHLRMNSALVQRRKRRDGSERVWVTKKSIIEHEARLTKEYLTQFTRSHPDIFRDFRSTTIQTDSLLNEELTSEDLDTIVDQLITELRAILPGPEHATRYHRVIAGILELIFYPRLICPQIEREIHNGRKRIDITFDNAAKEGFFWRLHTTLKIPAQFIIVECKNYKRDVANPELDQIAGRFSLNRGKFGLVVCRDIDDFGAFIKRCTDTYKDDRGVILPLIDRDIIGILEKVKERNQRPDEELLSDRFRDVVFQ